MDPGQSDDGNGTVSTRIVFPAVSEVEGAKLGGADRSERFEKGLLQPIAC